LKNWFEIKGNNFETTEELFNCEGVQERIWQEVEEMNVEFGKTRKIKKIKLLADEWSVDSGELTPTQKVKRKVILKKYEELINEMYVEEKS
nr:hypothetical protein [Melioribacteraceae bacterium]